MDLPAHPLPFKVLAAAAVLVTAASTAAAASTPAAAPTPVAVARVSAAPGDSTVIPGFLIQSSAQTSDTGATISTPGYNTANWVPVAARSTVFAGLVAAGRFPNPYFSTNMKNVNTADYSVPWWYRADLTLGSETGLRTYLNLTGVLSKADVFVNGSQIATSADVVGAYTTHELDVTALVHPGVNSLAVKVFPNDPNKDLTMGWIDWAQTPPDKNMGIVRDVVVHRGAGVALRDAHVVTALNATRDRADLTVKADVRNDTAGTLSTVVSGTVAGQAVSQTVSLTAHQTKTVTFPVVTLTNPQLWWPAGMGAQFLYDLDLSASVGGTSSDTAHESFGVREVKAVLDGSGHRRYSINGRALLIKGGGWSPDLLLRPNPTFVQDKLRYVLDMGLNTVRLEGHIEPAEFFDLTDRMGILTMPGWECCDKWEGNVNGSEPGDKWVAADFVTAKSSMSAEAKLLRDHPSVISFLIGSDFAPDAQIEQNYVDALNAADWRNPVITAAADDSAPINGSSGMKMNGPYEWVPPNYWYDKRDIGGGASGFASEISAGPDVPTMDTLRRMMSTTELNSLWQNFTATQYHRSQSSTFNTLKIFDNALAGRYGTVSSLDDYVKKAQLAQYENVRAQFEAYGRNFTDSSAPADGVIYWMLNSGWTSLHWQLFDYYLDQNGAYFGAKKAGEPLHIQYSYDNRNVVVVNSRHGSASGLTAKVDLFNPDGTTKFSQTASNLTAPGDGGRVTALTVPATVSGLATTYLARLLLTDSSGNVVSRNVYWLSTKADVIDWSKNDWFFAPTSAFADLKGLAGMAQANVSATATTATSGDTTTTSVTLRNTGTKPALFLDTHVLVGSTPVLPITWNDNDVSLFPGESVTLTGSYRTADLNGGAPSVRLTGWNAPTVTIPGNGGGGGGPTRLEAENATIGQGVAESNHLGFSGTGFVNYDNVVGSSVEFSVTPASAGPATLTIRYSNGTTTNRPMDITVNGVVVASGMSFPSTTNWDTWASATIQVNLNAGVNAVRATATTANGGPNVDYLEF